MSASGCQCNAIKPTEVKDVAAKDVGAQCACSTTTVVRPESLNALGSMCSCSCPDCQCRSQAQNEFFNFRWVPELSPLPAASFSVSGMTCGRCVNAIEDALMKLPTVLAVTVNLKSGLCYVKPCPPTMPDSKFIEIVIDAISDIGFEASATTDYQSECKIRIDGMTCSACVATVECLLLQTPGVSMARVALLAGRATITYDATIVTPEQCAEVVDDAGFEAKIIDLVPVNQTRISLEIDGFGPTEADRLRLVEHINDEMSSNEFITDIVWDTDRPNVIHVKFVPASIGPRDIVTVIEKSGCIAVPAADGDADSDMRAKKELKLWRRLLILGLIFTVPAFLVAMVIGYFHHSIMDALMTKVTAGLTIKVLMLWILSTPVQFVLGYRFYIGAYNALRNRHPNMDVLIAGGTTAAYVYSVISVVYGMARPGFESEQYFEVSAMLITFVFLGKYLEGVAKGKTSDALRALLDLQPNTANVVVNYSEDCDSEDPEIVEVPTKLLHVGDVVRVQPGERVSCDGEVIQGWSYIDESMVTGESVPVVKEQGSETIAGTVNQNGRLLIRATKVGDASTLQQIVKLVDEAQSSKAPIEVYADTVSSYFVPVVCLISLCTFVIWLIIGYTVLPDEWLPEHNSRFLLAFIFSITALVIACPCALGLAAPTAVMVGTGIGARHGILIKGGRAIEVASKINTVVFDKTGTLTIGKPQVTFFSCPDSTEEQSMAILSMIGAAEADSEHPIAYAIHNYAKETLARANMRMGLCLDFEAIPGLGLACKMRGVGLTKSSKLKFSEDVGYGSDINSANEEMQMSTKLWIGNSRLMTSINAEIDNTCSKLFGERMALAETALLIAVEGVRGKPTVVGIICVSDKVKDEARMVVSMLQSMYIQVYMMTGDNVATATAVAKQIGLPSGNVFAEVMPSDKSTNVKNLQDRGLKVAMVGDGINDSPALAQANVGIAIGSGTDVAMETSDMVLMKSDLRDLIIGFDIARRTFRRIKFNFFWALGYNSIMIPVAAGIFFPLMHPDRLPPWAAGIAMALSSISVVCSSLHLKYYKPPVFSSSVIKKSTTATGAKNETDDMHNKAALTRVFTSMRQSLTV